MSIVLQQAIDAGLAALDDGTEDQAVERLAPLLSDGGGSALGWQVLGLLYRAQEEHERALAALQRAAALDPASGLIANALAQVRLEAGLDAVAQFEHCLRLSVNAQVIQGLAAALVAQGRQAEAITLLDQTLHANPQWGEGQWLLARLRWMGGDRSGYLAALDRAQAQSAADQGLWQTRLAIRLRSLDFRGVLEDVQRADSALAELPFMVSARAAALTETGQPGEADALYARMPQPIDITDAVYRMRHLLRTGRHGEAARFGEVWAAKSGAHIWPYLAIAWRLLGDPRHDWLERQEGLVRTYDISAELFDIKVIADRLRQSHGVSGEPLEQSLRGGTQTDGPLFSRIEPEIRTLRRAIAKAVRNHIAQLPPSDSAHPQLGLQRDRPIRFAGAWSVRLTDSGHHVNHIHPEGWFSSALYLALPPGVDASTDADKSGWLALGEPESSLGLDLPAFSHVRPKVGTLALFPSTMWHGTVPFGGGERMTVAFDVAPPR